MQIPYEGWAASTDEIQLQIAEDSLGDKYLIFEMIRYVENGSSTTRYKLPVNCIASLQDAVVEVAFEAALLTNN